jgi:DNA integrity scanning protein DisA with diadenylate cyclase activity
MRRAAVRNDGLADQLFRAALDLADARHGALFVVLRRPVDSLPQLVASQDRLDMELVGRRADAGAPSRSHLLHLLAGRAVTELDPNVLEALATLDGATVTDTEGTLLAVGAILRHPLTSEHGKPSGITEGARTTAALAASRFGPVLKVSEDGMVSCYDNGRIWDL